MKLKNPLTGVFKRWGTVMLLALGAVAGSCALAASLLPSSLTAVLASGTLVILCLSLLAGRKAWLGVQAVVDEARVCSLRSGLTELRAKGESEATLQDAISVLADAAVESDGALAEAERVQEEERRANEQELATMRADHAEEVGQLGDQARARTGLLAKLSHGIRTPMNGILGMTELALDAGLDGEPRDYVEIARDSAQELLEILDEVVSFSRVETDGGDLRPEPFGLRSFVGGVLHAHAARAQAKGLEVTGRIAPDAVDGLVGDHALLGQVLKALLVHGVRRTRQGEVVLSVDQVQLDGEQVLLRFSVSDTGARVDPADFGRLLKLFRAEDGGSAGLDGTSLGLALADRFVTILGGRLTCAGGAGQGAAFQFDVPLAMSHSSASTHVDIDELAVLVVEANETARDSLLVQLESWGADVTAVASAAEALEALDAADGAGSPLDLILLDEGAPPRDCYWFASQVAARQQPRPKLVAMLGYAARSSVMEKWRAMGGQASLRKPIRTDELRATAARSVSSARPQLSSPTMPPTAPRPPKQRWRVLVVEDNPVNQQVLLKILDRAGHAAVVVGNGQEAVDITADEDFDVILMDLQMPVLDGLEATRQIRVRESRTGKATPIVAVTAHVLKSERIRCHEAGMDAHVGKPLNSEALLTLIAGLLEPHSLGGTEGSEEGELVGAGSTLEERP